MFSTITHQEHLGAHVFHIVRTLGIWHRYFVDGEPVSKGRYLRIRRAEQRFIYSWV